LHRQIAVFQRLLRENPRFAFAAKKCRTQENKPVPLRILVGVSHGLAVHAGARAVTERSGERLTPEDITRLYLELREKLTAFALGLLRNRELAQEVVQATFRKALESTDEIRGDLRGWLFRVACNEAMAIRRRKGVEDRWRGQQSGSQPEVPLPHDDLIRWEQVKRVRDALERLPPEQRTVVRMRIYEELTFAEIAQRLSIPLGTVLTRMRLATGKLQHALRESE
jgi:RNA polymerase sigma-70 factor (ECF subfamily)